MAKPGGTGPVGPFPSNVADTDDAHDEYDRMRRRLLWKMPSGLYVVGSTDGAQRRNGNDDELGDADLVRPEVDRDRRGADRVHP